MAIRKFEFTNGEFYHIFNRGVDKRDIFLDKSDIERFFKSMEEFNTIDTVGGMYRSSLTKNQELRSKASQLPKLVNFICYCLNPNHFHFILEQISDKGVEKFMQRLGTGYTKYFNSKNNRSGSLFQGKFKAIYLPNDSNQLLHTSVYVNLNNKIHKLRSKASQSSWGEYVDDGDSGLCKKDVILDQFDNKKEYKKFAEELLVDIKKQREEEEELEELLLD